MRYEKIKFIITFMLLVFASCEKKGPNTISLNKLNKKASYLIFRSTDTKQGFFAREFNIRDTINSHVGLLLYDNKWLIYNVSDFERNKSALQSQSFVEFQKCNDGKVTDISIWSIKNNDTIIKRKALNEIKEIMRTKVTFDKFFVLNNKNLYCSEFIVNVLEKTDTLLTFKPIKREIKGIYRSYFRKDTLEYYPVDIFQYNDNFKKIYEWELKK